MIVWSLIRSQFNHQTNQSSRGEFIISYSVVHSGLIKWFRSYIPLDWNSQLLCILIMLRVFMGIYTQIQMVIRSCINWLYSHPIETQQHNRVLWLFSNTQIFNFYCYISSVVSWTPATSYNKARGYSTTELCIWPPQHLRFKGPRAGKGDQDWINIMEPTLIAQIDTNKRSNNISKIAFSSSSFTILKCFQ